MSCESGRFAPQNLTRAIDLRKLRDAQAPDFKKNQIPTAATDGSVSWIRLDNVPVTGRLVVISRHGGIASAYDCCTCSCSASLIGISSTPSSFDVLPGTTMQCSCTATFQSCNGADSFYNETSSATWSSTNTAVATMDSTTKGLVHGVAAGTSTIKATYSGYKYTVACQPQPCTGGCIATQTTDSGSSTCYVTTTSISGPSAVPLCSGCPANGVNTIQLTATGNPPGGAFSWTTTSSNVTLSNAASATVTVTSAAASGSKGDTPVKVTYTVSGQSGTATQNITVQKPTALLIQSPDTTTNESQCTVTSGGKQYTGCGVTRTFTYQVQDQFSPANAIDTSGMQLWDSITIGSPNQLSMGQPGTTCSPPNTGPCAQTTGSSGQFTEHLSVCSTVCYSSGTCVTAGDTSASETWHINGFSLGAIQLTYYCNKILVNGG